MTTPTDVAQALRELSTKWRSQGEAIGPSVGHLARTYCADDLDALLEAHESRAQPASEHTEDSCERCGGKNIKPWFAPSPIWNKVADRHWSIICPQCFVELAQAAGFNPTAWRIAPEGYTGPDDDPARNGAQPASVADGWMMVPKGNVTSDMVRVGMEWITNCQTDFDRACMVTCIFGEMCKVAPQPPSIDGLSQSGLVETSGDVDQSVSVLAAGAQEEAPVVVDVGLDSAEHDLKTTVLAGPHGVESTPAVAEAKYRYALTLFDAAEQDEDGMAGVAFSAQVPLEMIDGKSASQIAEMLCEDAAPQPAAKESE